MGNKYFKYILYLNYNIECIIEVREIKEVFFEILKTCIDEFYRLCSGKSFSDRLYLNWDFEIVENLTCEYSGKC